MAVKICTTGGSCIRCDASWEAVQKAIKGAKAKDFICCGHSCAKVDQITTVEEVPREEVEEEQQRGGRRSTEEITTF
jgi:hypothetical protein